MPGDDPGAWTTDYDEHGADVDPPITPEQAEAVLSRLKPGDLVTYTGYPGRPGKRIAVTRDGRTIASMVFSHTPDGIDALDGEICSVDAAIPPVIQEEIEHG